MRTNYQVYTSLHLWSVVRYKEEEEAQDDVTIIPHKTVHTPWSARHSGSRADRRQLIDRTPIIIKQLDRYHLHTGVQILETCEFYLLTLGLT